MKDNNYVISHLNQLMLESELLTITQMEDGHVTYRWPTQSFNDTVCELSHTGIDLYDGFLGNLLTLYFYSEYFDKSKKTVYCDYLLYFQRMLLKNHRHLDFNVGAYGDLGGALFVLSTLYIDSGNSNLLPLISSVYNLIDQQVDAISSTDYIYGLSGLTERLAYSQKCKISAVNPLLERCKQRLKQLYLTENNRYGYAHGAFSTIVILENTNIINDYSRLAFPDLLNKIKEFKRGKSSWSHSWCNGELGELYTYLALYRKNHCAMLLNHIHERFFFIFNEIKEFHCPNYSLCHGSLGLLDFGIELYKLSLISNNSIRELAYFVLRKPFPHVDYQLSSNGIMVGRLGKAYQILRFLLPEKVPSLLASLL